MANTLRQAIESAEFLDALGRHFTQGLMLLHNEVIPEVTKVDICDSIADDAMLVRVTLRVRPAFL